MVKKYIFEMIYNNAKIKYMGLFDKLRGEFIDIIEFLDNTQDTIVYRFERYGNEIKNNAKLIVRAGQIFLLLTISLLYACEEKHFITDATYRKMVEEDFQKKQEIFGKTPGDLFAIFDSSMTVKEREALMFLYAYSPLIDISFSGGEFFLKNVRLSFRAQEEMPWGKAVPEEIFRHFVLPVRGGKENLDSARVVFYEELKERVAACGSMEKAALEVNHWCHEHVIYKPTNARTSSPLATKQRAYGRCGEESVFTLAALRAVGIPARQIYTPRWAHCDDNHAWIEVWIDGEWKYLGACEPEPRLNIAWFTLPVQRALYVEAEVFGKYAGGKKYLYENGNFKIWGKDGGEGEEIVSVGDNSTIVNVTSHYTDSGQKRVMQTGILHLEVNAREVRNRKTVVQILDEKKQPVEHAKVEYKIFNYGEFYPVVTLYSDEQGETVLTLAQGDLLVWATKGEQFGFARFPVSRQDTLVITLDKKTGDAFSGQFSLVPPEQRDIKALTTAEERAVNDRRFVHEDSLRNAYIATFMTTKRAREIADELKIDTARFTRYVKMARGNDSEIEKLFRQAPDKELAMRLLDVVTEKDLQDTPADVWLAHLVQQGDGIDNEMFQKYVLNPRIQNELITAYREPIKAAFGSESLEGMKSSDLVERIMHRVGEYRVTAYPVKVPTPPVGVLRAGITDALSRDIFFVAVCRTYFIPARLSPISGKPEYYIAGDWHTADFSTEKFVPRGKLMLHYAGKPVRDPKYFLNFTIGKMENGRVRTIDLGSNADVDMGVGASYETIFARPVELEEGNYILSTGNRRGDGAVMATLTSFKIEADRQTDLDMYIQPCEENTKVLGKVSLPLSYVSEITGKSENINIPGKGYTAIALVEADKEPANHLLRDMSGMKDDFDRLGIPLYFVFRDPENRKKFNQADFRPFPSVIMWGTDQGGKLHQQLSRDLQLQNAENLPLVVLLNAEGDVVFISQGYRVGLGTQIMNVMNRK